MIASLNIYREAKKDKRPPQYSLSREDESLSIIEDLDGKGSCGT